MPLIKGKSKHAFDENMGTEMKAGKPKPQSLAIAFAMKKKAKKMADGGVIKDLPGHKDEPLPEQYAHGGMTKRDRAMHAFAKGGKVNEMAEYDPMEYPMAKHDAMAMHEDDKDLNQHHVDEMMMAEGGNVSHQSDSHMLDMVEKIMMKRMPKDEPVYMSEGGKVANEDSGESVSDPVYAKANPNEFDDLALRDDLSSSYNAMNSGDEDGSKLNQDDDDEDMTGRIMKKRSK